MLSIIKLTNGDEVLGELQTETDDEYVFANPLKVIYQFRPGAPTPTVYLHKVTLFGDSKVVNFPKRHILFTAKPKKGLDKYYAEMLLELNESEKIVEDDLLLHEYETVKENSLNKEDVYNMILESMAVTGNTSVN